ncbi:hypothetical protein BH11PSE11_BH11PSE11_26970 [soil metagenome]
MIEIEETTVGDLQGVAVGVGNIWERDHVMADGRLKRGLTAQLFIDDTAFIVGKGSVFELKGECWEVVEVRKSATLGQVSIKKIQSPEGVTAPENTETRNSHESGDV